MGISLDEILSGSMKIDVREIVNNKNNKLVEGS